MMFGHLTFQLEKSMIFEHLTFQLEKINDFWALGKCGKTVSKLFFAGTRNLCWDFWLPPIQQPIKFVSIIKLEACRRIQKSPLWKGADIDCCHQFLSIFEEDYLMNDRLKI